MNQMVGSAATSMATMFMREVNISPPLSKIWSDLTEPLAEGILDDEALVKVSFSLTIGTLVDSYMMQLLPMGTAKKIVSIMMGQEDAEMQPKQVEQPVYSEPEPQVQQRQQHSQPEPQYGYQQAAQYGNYPQQAYEQPAEIRRQPQVEVHQAAFQPLGGPSPSQTMPKNIDLILDVPLEISVVLGRTKKNIKDILNLGTGSLIELDKLAEEPVEILVNGKKVAYGEVVVVDENFGVRITSIVSNEERIKSLGR
jgi:flagellar motor switch protein FliN/FliY